MRQTFDIKNINKTLYFGLIALVFSLIILIFRYIGIGGLVLTIVKALVPVLLAIFISFLLEPIIKLFIKIGVKRKMSVLITYFLFVSIVGLIIYFTFPILVDQIKVFINNIPALINIITNFIEKTGININSDIFDSFIMRVSNAIIESLSSTVDVIYVLILAMSGALFLSFDFVDFKETVKIKIPSKLKRPIVYYFENFLPFVHKYFLGMFIDSIIILAISLIGFSIIGIDYALVISIFIAFTNLIPIIGPYIGGVPAAIVGFSVSSTMGVSAIIVVVLVQLLESNFIQPLILKNVIELHPLEGILGISLFGALFGVIGMVLSPILIVSIKLLFLPYNEKIESAIKKEEKNNPL